MTNYRVKSIYLMSGGKDKISTLGAALSSFGSMSIDCTLT